MKTVYTIFVVISVAAEEFSMFISNWKKEIFTIPNLLSLFRLLLIPVYVILYLNASTSGDYLLAGLIISVSCLTDMIDGKIARQFNMVSNLGKILDPLADKVTQFTLILCLSTRYPVLNPVLSLFFLKETFQSILGLVYLSRGKMLPGALMAGKICTAVLFVSLIALVLFPRLPADAITAIAAADSVFLAVSFACYIRAYWGNASLLHDLNTE